MADPLAIEPFPLLEESALGDDSLSRVPSSRQWGAVSKAAEVDKNLSLPQKAAADVVPSAPSLRPREPPPDALRGLPAMALPPAAAPGCGEGGVEGMLGDGIGEAELLAASLGVGTPGGLPRDIGAIATSEAFQKLWLVNLAAATLPQVTGPVPLNFLWAAESYCACMSTPDLLLPWDAA